MVSPTLEQLRTIEGEIRVPIATAQLVRYHITDPIDLVTRRLDDYWLDLSLGTRTSESRVGYPEHWNARRFERIGKAYVLPPDEAIHTLSERATHTSIVCHLHPEPVQKWLDSDLKWTSRRLEVALDIPSANIHNPLLRMAEELRHPGFASAMLVELLAGQLAIELGRYLLQPDGVQKAGELARWRLRLVDERLQDAAEIPTLDELAGLCRLSVRQLTRGFRASRGCSIGDHVADARVARAKRLLAGDQSVKTIAYSLGFTSSSGFCFAFRRATGMTPGEFRAGR
jgi:AraC family transcriptional regulator